VKKIVRFFKTTAIGGLLVIVPIAIILYVLAELFYVLYSLAEALISTLNIEIDDALIMVGIAAAALIALCFLTGLLIRTRFGLMIKRGFNRHIGDRIPMYNALASLTQRFAGQEGSDFAPVEVDMYHSSARAIGFRIENLPGDRCAVFVPSAPVATIGNIYVVARCDVTDISASVTDTFAAITQWGVDSKKLYCDATGTDEAEPQRK